MMEARFPRLLCYKMQTNLTQNKVVDGLLLATLSFRISKSVSTSQRL